MAAPIGNTNAVKGRRWANAIDAALKKRSKAEGQKALVALAEELLKKCEDGDMAALKELGDRIDGKVAQSVALSGAVGAYDLSGKTDEELKAIINGS